MAPLLIVLSGPSGVGKDTLIHKLLLTEPKMRKITTVTTRAPRLGEVDGRDHYFVSLDRFRKLIEEGALLEHARVYDNWYGVPKADVDDSIRDGLGRSVEDRHSGCGLSEGPCPEGVDHLHIAGR